MKTFIKNFFRAIPLALGLVLTILSVVSAMNIAEDPDYIFGALFCGLLGVPLLFASVVSLARPRGA